jgi:hypothetical protein
MKVLLKIFRFALSLLMICYLLFPSPSFPSPPSGALRSNEPGDMESVYRRAYFTNLTRSEALAYYGQRFGGYLINYPPEEAFSLIRDQTKSSWLQEFVHPFKESLYVNGFYPTKPTEQINIDGVHYLNKLIIRYVPSSPVARLTGLTLCIICGFWLYKEYVKV